MSKIRFFIVAMIAAVTLNVAAQKPVMTFEEKKYDFGKINEADGNVSHVFEFTNTGNAPLIIQRVNSSCGCTTPEWTQSPVEPGGKGKITATYHALGRPGVFNKQIYVLSNASNEQEVLVISGTVIPKSQPESNASPASKYPMQIGDLNLNSLLVQFNNVEKSETQTRTIGIKNNTPNNLSVSVSDVPAYLTVTANPKILKPNEEGTLNVTFDGKKVPEWGPVNDKISLVLNGKKVTSDKITIAANVIENFSKMSVSDKRQAPIVEIKSSNLYFGSVKQGSKVRGKVGIKNVGINPLEIRRIVNTNGEIAIVPLKMNIRSGHTDNLKIDIDAKSLPKGDYKRSFTIQTNDPVNTYITFVITYKVI
jgi:hypothetical protein